MFYGMLCLVVFCAKVVSVPMNFILCAMIFPFPNVLKCSNQSIENNPVYWSLIRTPDPTCETVECAMSCSINAFIHTRSPEPGDQWTLVYYIWWSHRPTFDRSSTRPSLQICLMISWGQCTILRNAFLSPGRGILGVQVRRPCWHYYSNPWLEVISIPKVHCDGAPPHHLCYAKDGRWRGSYLVIGCMVTTLSCCLFLCWFVIIITFYLIFLLFQYYYFHLLILVIYFMIILSMAIFDCS